MSNVNNTLNGRIDTTGVVLSARLSNILRSIEQLTTNLDTTHSVFVENQVKMPTSMKVETEGFDKVIQQLRSDTGSLKTAIDNMREAISGIKFPDIPTNMNVRLSEDDIKRLQVTFPEIRIPEIPTFMQVSDSQVQVKLEELIDSIRSIRTAKSREAKVKVENKLNIPQELLDMLTNLTNLQFLSDDPEQPLAVRLSDGDKFYEAVMEATKETIQAIPLPIPAYKTPEGRSAQTFVDGNSRAKVTSDNYTTKIAYVATGGSPVANGAGEIEYVGKALPGSATSASVWQIQKLSYDANDKLTDVQWAGSADTFLSVWNDRASLSYG